MTDKCRCKDCKKAKRHGLILGTRVLKHLGDGAYAISAYVRYHRYQKGGRPDKSRSIIRYRLSSGDYD